MAVMSRVAFAASPVASGVDITISVDVGSGRAHTPLTGTCNRRAIPKAVSVEARSAASDPSSIATTDMDVSRVNLPEMGLQNTTSNTLNVQLCKGFYVAAAIRSRAIRSATSLVGVSVDRASSSTSPSVSTSRTSFASTQSRE